MVAPVNNNSQTLGRIARLLRVWNWRLFRIGRARIGKIKELAKWHSLKIVTSVTGGLAFISDFFRPMFDIAHWVALVAILATAFFAATMYWIQPERKSTQRMFARSFLCSWIFAIVFTCVTTAQLLVPENESATSRVLVPVRDLQEILFPIQKQVEQVAEDVSVIRESSERQEKTLTRVEESTDSIADDVAQIDSNMSVSLAVETLDRAVASKNGSMQGQNRAIETLLHTGYSFRNVEYSGIALRKANLANADFANAVLEGSDLSDANLSNAVFSGASFEFALLRKVRGPRADFSAAYLPYANLEGSDLTKADLSRANLYGADLRNVSLRAADLSGASLVGADLRGADLRGANLKNTVLFGAILDGAQLNGAIFDNTDIGSAVGIDLPSNLKAPQVCARNGSGYMRTKIIEATPSTRFDSGFAFEEIFTYTPRPVIPVESHFYNEECRDVSDEEMPVSDSPVFRQTIYGDHLGFRLPNDLLNSAGRRARFQKRLEEHEQLLKKHLDPAKFYRSIINKFDAQVQYIEDATRKLRPPAYDCLDSDTADILKTHYGFAESSTLHNPAFQRFSAEKARREFAKGNPDRTSHLIVSASFPGDVDIDPGSATPSWGYVFDESVTEEQVGGPIVAAYDEWRQHRLDVFDNEVALCIGTRKTDSQLPTDSSGGLVAKTVGEPSGLHHLVFFMGDFWVIDLRDKLDTEIQSALTTNLDYHGAPRNFDLNTRFEILLDIAGIEEHDVGQSWKIYEVDARIKEQRIRRIR